MPTAGRRRAARRQGSAARNSACPGRTLLSGRLSSAGTRPGTSAILPSFWPGAGGWALSGNARLRGGAGRRKSARWLSAFPSGWRKAFPSPCALSDSRLDACAGSSCCFLACRLRLPCLCKKSLLYISMFMTWRTSDKVCWAMARAFSTPAARPLAKSLEKSAVILSVADFSPSSAVFKSSVIRYTVLYGKEILYSARGDYRRLWKC